MVLVFATTILLGAALLFVVQPLIARLLLPLLGGSPAVWNTCMVFFQSGLVAGYAYAHVLSRGRSPRLQFLVHVTVVAAALAALPIAVRTLGPPPADGAQVPWLLTALALSVGLPFFVVATTGPLLQRWFALTDHPHAHDPYFLYAASNLGSLGGLLAYPFAIEPMMRLAGSADGSRIAAWWPPTQTGIWSLGYGAFVVLVAACAGLTWRRRNEANRTTTAGGDAVSSAPTWRRRALWAVLAFVPSSLLLGATQFITTNLAAIPLLWVIPLALYLGTFIAAFSGKIPRLVPASGVALAILVVGIAATANPGPNVPPAVTLPLHLLTLTAAGLVAHGRLAGDRPPADRLTDFYFWIAVGGALGGAFNALIAPLIFPDLWEYPIVLGLACFLRVRWSDESEAPDRLARALDFAVPAGLAILIALLAGLGPRLRSLGYGATVWLQVGLPSMLGLAMIGWRRRFAWVAVVLLAGAWVRTESTQTTLHRERTFFGVHRVLEWEGPPYVTEERDGEPVRPRFHVLVHGTTRHGSQSLDPDLSRTPTTYYARSGPIGQVFETLRARGGPLRVALVGLGAGTLAAYGDEGDRFTVYEIDPAVVRIANDRRFFTYLGDSKAWFETVIGDGRLSIARALDRSFDLIVLDAFSSDAIPVHLLTREAVAIDLRKLAPGGLLAIHLSNRHLQLAPVVEAIAADLGVRGGVRLDRTGEFRDVVEGKDESTWAILAADPRALDPFAGDERWWAIPRDPGARPDRSRLWTDDYSNLIGSMKLF